MITVSRLLTVSAQMPRPLFGGGGYAQATTHCDRLSDNIRPTSRPTFHFTKSLFMLSLGFS